MITGDVSLSSVELHYTPLIKNPRHYYTIELTDISLGDRSLQLEPVSSRY
jgi:hypothetical protein